MRSAFGGSSDQVSPSSYTRSRGILRSLWTGMLTALFVVTGASAEAFALPVGYPEEAVSYTHLDVYKRQATKESAVARAEWIDLARSAP